MNFKSIESFGKKVLKTGIAIGLFAGAESPVQAENFKSNDNDPDKTEAVTQLSEKNPAPESYNANEKIKHLPRVEEKAQRRLNNPMGELLEDMSYSELMVCYIKIESIKKYINNKEKELSEMQSELLTIEKNSTDYSRIMEIYEEKHQEVLNSEEDLKKLNNQVKELQANQSNVLNDKKIKNIYENFPKTLEKIENVRKELIEVVSSKQYLRKIQSEFDCSIDEAKKHQTVRINNLKSVSISFKSSLDLGSSYFGNTPAAAEYHTEYHQICLPYDESDDRITHFALHEFIHSITNGDLGLSAKSVKILNSSARENKKFSKNFHEYLLRPSERYVRLKMLELELEKLGIKKFGEKISQSGYKKMIKWLEDKNENRDFYFEDNIHFLQTTKGLDDEKGRQVVNNIFEEIADNQEIDNHNDYKHPNWDYNNPENLA